MTMRLSNLGAGIFMLGLIAMVLIVVGMMAGQAQTVTMPREVAVQPMRHAEVRHGIDALMARLAMYNCDPIHIRVFVSGGVNPKSAGKWLFVCPDSLIRRCAGMITNTAETRDGYIERTTFVSSCDYWLNRVPVRDGYIPASTAIVKKALELLLVMEVEDENSRD